MLIQSVTIKNVRSIESITFSLNDEVTVFMGKNGAGKSAILEAISLALGKAVKRSDPLRMDKDGNKASQLSVSIELKRQKGEGPTLAAPGPNLHIEYTRSSDGIQQWRVGQRIRTGKEVRSILSELGLDLHGSLAVIAQQDALNLAQLSPTQLSLAIEQAAGVKAFREAVVSAKRELSSVNLEILKIRSNISRIIKASRLPNSDQINDAKRYLEAYEIRSKWEDMRKVFDDAKRKEKEEQQRLKKEIKMFVMEDKIAFALRLRPDIYVSEEIKKTRQKIEDAKKSVPLQWKRMSTVGSTLYFNDPDTCLEWILVLSRILSPSKLNILLSDTREGAIALARNQNSRVWALEALISKNNKTKLIPGTTNLHDLIDVKLTERSRFHHNNDVLKALKQRILSGLPKYGVQTPSQAKELVNMGLSAATPDGTFYFPGRIDGGFVLEHSQLRSLIVSFFPLPELPNTKFEEAMKEVLNFVPRDVEVQTPIHKNEVKKLSVELSEFGHPVIPKVPGSLLPLLEGLEHKNPKDSIIELLNKGESSPLALQERLKQLELAAETLKEDVKKLTERVSQAFLNTAKLIKEKFSASVSKCNSKLKTELKINPDEGKAWIECDGINVSQLSGGQKSLLAVCLSLAVVSVAASGCNLVILDEIDAALDDIARNGIRELVKEEFKKNQVILVSHHPGMVSENWGKIMISKINGVTHVDAEQEGA